jgi:DNA-binding transcriptional LysR family regulator
MIMRPHQWADLELRHLVSLQAVVEAGSFHGAAERLDYTQSAISQHIAALESIVGVRLIERSRGRKSVEVTEAGELLLHHADAIVARLRAAQADLAAYGQGAAGILRVGTYQSAGTRIVPLLVRRFSAAWPDVEIRLTEAANDDLLLQLIERGELDLTFAIFPLPQGPFEAVELMHDPYVLVVPRESALAERGQEPSLAEIAALPLISFRLCRSTEAAESHLRRQGLEPRIVFRSDDNGTVQGLVAAGVGAALVPILTVDRGDPEVVALGTEVPPRIVALAWHRDRFRSPAARAFVTMAGEIAGEVAEELQRDGLAATA